MPRPLATALKILVLIYAGTVVAAGVAFAAWRSWFCTTLATIQPADLDAYLSKRIAFREVCGFLDWMSPVAMLFIHAVIVWLVWYSLRRQPETEAAGLLEAHSQKA